MPDDFNRMRWRRILNLRPGEIVVLAGRRRRLVRRSVLSRGAAVRLYFGDGGTVVLHPLDRLRIVGAEGRECHAHPGRCPIEEERR